jgi:cytochrome b involved in lipid metabolism
VSDFDNPVAESKNTSQLAKLSFMSETTSMRMKTRLMAISLVLSIPMGLVTATSIKAAPNTTKSITLETVKAHNKPTDCWLVVNRKVYNLTALISQQPASASRVIPMCGKDASQAFNALYAGQESTNNLAQYQIGVIKKKK